MEIKIIKKDKKMFLDLLLIADESENMIDKYFLKGEMFALFEDDLKSICVVTKESEDVYEIKNIGTYPKYQKKGYGKKLINHILEFYKDKTILVGTGDIDYILNFYKSCGFIESHIIKNFFIDNYDHPMFEEGKQIVDMVYLSYNK